ncbi:MAG: amidohydrolase family protein [Acidobacteria bacterium]|nr:amidohydrolase family protein [Acidobacteriota bacterium]MBI3423701.1 amidohydrolase family protein [Acidobacteriota bacterium]
MKQKCLVVLFLALLASLCAAQSPRPLALSNVTVIDATGKPAQRGMTVLIEGERISKLFKTGKTKLPPNAEIIDASGKFLIPGLWDMHIHLTNQPDQTLSREWMLPLLTAFGVTGIREMGGDWQHIHNLRQAISASQSIGPRIIAPGPFVDGPGFVDKPVRTPEKARQQVRELKTLGVDFIKVQANLSPECYRAVLAEAKALGLTVAGHVPEAVSAFEVARSGQRSIEHSSPILPGDAGIMLSCSSKEDALRAELLAIKKESEAPNADRQQLRLRQRKLQTELLETYDARKCAGLFTLLRQNNVWVVPTQIWAQRLLPLNAEDIIDPIAKIYLPLKTRTRFEQRRSEGIKITAPESFALRQQIAAKTRKIIGAMRLAGVPLLAGTDAYDGAVLPGFSLHQELELLTQSGLTPMEALQTATRNAAQYFGEAATRGTIEVGNQADLVLLEADPLQNITNTRQIYAVIQGGKLLSAQARQALLERIKAFAAEH